MHSQRKKRGDTEKAWEKFILVGIENSVISIQENKVSSEDCDEAEYDILKKIKKVSRNYSLQQVVDIPREKVWLS